MTFDEEMKKDKEWYLAWQPGNPAYTRDDVILAVGLKCDRTRLYLRDIISWLGPPDKVDGNTQAGDLAYYFENQQDTFASFTVIDNQVKNFGTVTRKRDNAIRKDPATGTDTPFNILDVMDAYAGSEMKNGIEQGGPGYPPQGVGSPDP